VISGSPVWNFLLGATGIANETTGKLFSVFSWHNMLMIPHFQEKRAAGAMLLCMLFGLSALAYAGAIDTQKFEGRPAPDGEAEDSGIPSLESVISIEERMRLHRDLAEYSRSIDSSHIVIENHRRSMRQRLYERFSASDKDNDGSISREEATETLPQIARHFSQVDANGDGVITLNELAIVHARMVERQQRAAAMDSENQAREVDVVKSKEKEVTASTRKKAL
jgi:hypothetical protein